MIFIDTREQANTHILRAFENSGLERGFDYCDEKLDFGDYYCTDTGIAIERKKNLIEFAGNCGKGHARFKAELEELKSCGDKMYILIEQPIKYEQIADWINPRGKTKSRTLKDGTVKEISAMTGAQMKRICDHWIDEYEIEFIFCTKAESGKTILELLEWTY